MSYIVKDNGSGDFELLESGLHQAVCSHVVPLGMHESPWGEKEKVALCFELADIMHDGRPFMLSKMYTASLNEKANLRKDLESWRGRKFTEEEIKGFDIEALLGVQVYLNLTHETKNNKTYANISSMVKLPAGFPPITRTGQKVPEWLKKLAEKGMAMAEFGAPPAETNNAQEDLPF